MGWDAQGSAARAATRSAFGEVAAGRTVTYNVLAGGTLAIDGVFRRSHETVDVSPSGGAAVSAFQATLGSVDLSAIPAGVQTGDTVDVQGTRWGIQDTLEDGEGGTTLVLNDLGPLP